MIEFKNVYKTYPNGFTALKNVNLNIEQGEFVAIIGLSGAGKSTILRCINRMHDIQQGTLTVDDVDVESLSGKALRRFRRKVGMIFQSFNLVSRSTVIKNVLTADVPDMPFWRVLFGIFTKEQKMRALESLDKVGILDKAYTRCDQLSGGQQQRVALARTLNQNPSIILADEPVASLDPVTARQVMSDFVRINKEYKITILLNIHHVDLALNYCDRVIGVRAGEIVFDGPASSITQEQLDEVYNGTAVPTTEKFMSEEYKAPKAKVKLFDRIFKPQVITIANGHTTVRPRSRMPLILIVLFIVLFWAFKMTGFSFATVFSRINELFVILGKIFHPKWSFFGKVISPLIDTIKMSVLGTVIGCAAALPFAVLASSNIIHNRVVVSVIRFILALVRTVPTLIIALVCALIFSLGTFAGTLAIAIFTFGVVAKMLYESIETIDMGPFEAMEALGANKFQAFWSACIPQILPVYLSHSLYCFEMNVRASAILGYVGAGGLGITINERIGWRDYNGLGMVLLALFVVVVAIEFFSEYLRKKLS